MGYMTEFQFQCDCTDEKRMEQIVQKMRELQIVPYVFSEDLENYDPCTWYTEEKDMRALSRDFPDVHFIISAFGEINDDIWEAHYLGGKRQLCDEKVISQFELSTAENALLTAQAQQAQAEAQELNARNDLSYCTVTSPADGVVGTIPYRVGALVSSASASPLTTVSDNSVMYVYFSLPENRMLSLIRKYGSVEETLKRMPPVGLRLNDGTQYDAEGRVESISGVIDAQTGAVSFRAAFPNPSGLLHSGGAGNVLITERTDSALTIPQSATYELQDKVFAYRVEHGKAKATRLEVTPLNEEKLYIVRSGLSAGE